MDSFKKKVLTKYVGYASSSANFGQYNKNRVEGGNKTFHKPIQAIMYRCLKFCQKIFYEKRNIKLSLQKTFSLQKIKSIEYN